MLRHKRRMNADDDDDDDDDENECIFSDEGEHSADSETDMESAADDTDGENAESPSEDDPWYAMINRAFEDLQPQFDDKVKETVESENLSVDSARADVYEELRPFYRKAVLISWTGCFGFIL